MTITATGPVIVFLGPPGSGKGSQSKKLSKALNLPHISTGDLLRSYSTQETPLAKTIQEKLSKGEYLPDSLLTEMLQERVAREDCKGGFILDGFPRNVAQCKILDQLIADPLSLIFVEVILDHPTIVDRLTKRRTCSGCSKIYHLDFAPPKEYGECDECKSPLIQRADDKNQVILNRLKIFEEQYSPMLSYYNNRKHWIKLDAKESIEACFESLIKQIQPLMLMPLTS